MREARSYLPDDEPTNNAKEIQHAPRSGHHSPRHHRPQVDFLKPESVVWDLVGEMVEKNDVLDHLVQLKQAADAAGIPVFYSHTSSTPRSTEAGSISTRSTR